MLIDFSSCAVIVLTNQLIGVLNEGDLSSSKFGFASPVDSTEQIWSSLLAKSCPSSTLDWVSGVDGVCQLCSSSCRLGWAGGTVLCQGGASPSPGRAQCQTNTQGCQLPQLGPVVQDFILQLSLGGQDSKVHLGVQKLNMLSSLNFQNPAKGF